MMEWWQQNDCPLCGASNCWCDCLEQLQAYNRRGEERAQATTHPSLWQRFMRWLKGT